MIEGSVVLFGGSGRFGKEFKQQHPDVFVPNRNEVDISNYLQVQNYLQDMRPSVVVHAAAKVGLLECDEDKTGTYQVNVLGTQYIAKGCISTNSRLVYISSASIFDGEQGCYREDAIPNPQYFYALTKLLGERSASMVKNSVVVRTDFFVPGEFKYKTVLTDHYCSKVPVEELVRKVTLIAESDFTGVINVGRDRESLFEILKPYIPDIVPVTIAESSMPSYPRDLSLDVSLFKMLF